MVDWRDWKKQLNNKKNSLNEQSSEELILIDLKSSIAPIRDIKKFTREKKIRKFGPSVSQIHSAKTLVTH